MNWESLPIFLQPWWLDLVAANQWNVSLLENTEEIYAVMPYVLLKGNIRMPQLTPFLGPWWKIYSDKYAKKISNEVNYLTELFSQLPAFSRYEQRWHYSLTNWLPLYWNGYNQTTKYHYIITDTTNIENVWNDFKDKIRKQVRNAEKELKVNSNYGVKELYNQWMFTFGKQNLDVPSSFETISSIYNQVMNRNCGRAFFAEDANGKIHGALLIVRDQASCYGLISGADPQFKSSAPAYLLWEGIKYASSLGLQFNFCGSVIKPIENFLRDFGGQQMPYFEITKTNSKGLLFKQGIRLMIRSVKGS
jgi:hypothetical protein